MVKTTDGYNYLAMNDDIYLYTGLTSAVTDESTLGFILTNMRTGETSFIVFQALKNIVQWHQQKVQFNK